jgi:hypothetical protein
MMKSYVAADLRNRELPVAYRAHLSVEKSRLEDEIKRLVDSRILLEADISLKKKSITEKKRYYKKFRVKKKKINTPVSAGIENILLQFNISAAAYHGGKLNGVDCCELICLAKKITLSLKLIFLPQRIQIDAMMMLSSKLAGCTAIFASHRI